MRIKSISINTVVPTPRDIQTEALPIKNQLNPSIIAIAKRDTIPTCHVACDSSFDTHRTYP